MKSALSKIKCLEKIIKSSNKSIYPFARNVDQAVEFCIFGMRTFLDWLPGKEQYLEKKWFMEIGPGQEIGLPLLTMGFGARAMVVDRYMYDWDDAFHPAFYSKLGSVAKTCFPGIDLAPIHSVIENSSYDTSDLVILKKGLEDLVFVKSDLIDISYSNATFEHLSNMREAISQLSRVTKPGGVGYHQIDLRDHRSFTRPLEHLTLSDAELDRLNQDNSNKIGTNLRASEFELLFSQAGFETEFDANDSIQNESYFNDVISRINSKFAGYSESELRIIGGRFTLKKSSNL